MLFPSPSDVPVMIENCKDMRVVLSFTATVMSDIVHVVHVESEVVESEVWRGMKNKQWERGKQIPSIKAKSVKWKAMISLFVFPQSRYLRLVS